MNKKLKPHVFCIRDLRPERFNVIIEKLNSGTIKNEKYKWDLLKLIDKRMINAEKGVVV